ncbi:hypothetical protein [Fodinibius sp. AD559]|uniref:hypothetical protein n=1 Tax=Fodinibius sp. AD559 TaxID=3424179 RepID=UPI004046B47E
MIDFKNIFALFACLLFASIGSAQNPIEEPSKFDLVIFGNNLDSNTEVLLRENPGTENSWNKLDSGHLISDEQNEFTSLIFSSLSTEKFAGQDIRENYIAIKINPSSSSSLNIRALYVLPHAKYTSDHLQNLHTAIQSDPEQIRKYSMGKLIFPRAQSISGDKKITEHIEMSVRHLKPGIQEVKWLDIIFSED